ncbi:hypothetical protein [Candidatus Spongiisocius sp.]|uniref:hypothetical protein n=1 Tax=Candidatus Spongiisocius sp. TaxID=3101273 RepID=UPI003B5BC328
MTVGDAIAAFWEEWPRLRGLLEQELARGDYGDGTEQLTDLTEAIDPGLEWDLLAGLEARHALCLSSALDPALRPLTEQWVRAAPEPDGDWEYHPARIPVTPVALEVGSFRIHPRDVLVVIEPDQSRDELNLTVGHPDFGGLDEVLQLQVVFRLLDDLLGEDLMESWVGSVDVVPHPLTWGVPFLDLADEVDRHAASATGQTWEFIEEEDEELGDSRLFINRSLKRIDHLDLDFVATVSIEVQSFDPVLVREVEKDLAGVLGTEGVIYAHRAFDDFTVLYAYVGEGAADGVRRLADRWSPQVYEVMVEPDPTWDTYEEMR